MEEFLGVKEERTFFDLPPYLFHLREREIQAIEDVIGGGKYQGEKEFLSFLQREVLDPLLRLKSFLYL